MIATSPTDVRADDALLRVHHHPRGPRPLAGETAQTLCGFVKQSDPDAWGKPCCPLCRPVLNALGYRCLAEEPM